MGDGLDRSKYNSPSILTGIQMLMGRGFAKPVLRFSLARMDFPSRSQWLGGSLSYCKSGRFRLACN
jgi:hypothetical protein